MLTETKSYRCSRCGWTGAFKVHQKAHCRPCKAVRDRRRYDLSTPEYRRQKWERQRARCLAKDPLFWRNRIKDRRAWILSGDVTTDQLRDLAERSGHKCHYCGEPVKVRIRSNSAHGFDHVVSKPNGGRHTVSNMVVSCWPCNRKKGTR